MTTTPVAACGRLPLKGATLTARQKPVPWRLLDEPRGALTMASSISQNLLLTVPLAPLVGALVAGLAG